MSIRDKEVRRKLTPDYDFGCKRPTMSNTYYRTFTKPHVHLENSGIERIEPDGVVGCDGTKRFIDTLVLATGFDVWDVNLPAIEVIGRDGRDLGKWWRENRFQAYEGVSVPYFPNFLTLASPYAWVGLSWFNTVEYQMRHMDRLLGEVQRRGGRTFEVTEQANARFLDQMTELLDDSVFQPRQLCDLPVVLVQPHRGSTAFPTHVGEQRRQGTTPIPIERLRNSLTTPSLDRGCGLQFTHALGHDHRSPHRQRGSRAAQGTTRTMGSCVDRGR